MPLQPELQKHEPMATTRKVPKVTYRTVILSSGNNTGIQVPEALVEELGHGKRPPVWVTVKGYRYRNTVAVMSGRYMISVSAEIRANAGVAGGDEVEVTLELDTEPREVSIPADFQKLLDRNKAAAKNFAALSYSNKKKYVLQIDQAKTEETRQRRMTKTIEELRGARS